MNTSTVEGRADVSIREISQECARNREDLVRRMRRLARSLNEEAERLATQADRDPLSHGVVQTEGVEIDQLCAVVTTQREALKRMVWVVKGEEK